MAASAPKSELALGVRRQQSVHWANDLERFPSTSHLPQHHVVPPKSCLKPRSVIELQLVVADTAAAHNATPVEVAPQLWHRCSQQNNGQHQRSMVGVKRGRMSTFV